MANYKVLSVREQGRLNPAGELEEMVVISIQTDMGATGKLEVPGVGIEELNQDMLKEALQKKADDLNRPFMLASL